MSRGFGQGPELLPKDSRAGPRRWVTEREAPPGLPERLSQPLITQDLFLQTSGLGFPLELRD